MTDIFHVGENVSQQQKEYISATQTFLSDVHLFPQLEQAKGISAYTFLTIHHKSKEQTPLSTTKLS